MSTRHSVLVVDDDPFMRELSRIHLERAGHVVSLAEGGAEGVAKARSLGPDAIVMDFSMPGLSGTDTLKQIRADPDLARTPVLMLTAWSSDASRLEAENLGATWLEKPLSGEALIDAVGRMIAA
ncbi:response regulator [Brevundimonas sp.]|uniref:response regulator n=1 Tax=Brevundimonas sp. TaxID=1871086 RepID=UPI001A21E6F0|nr:response regulator [Brevundimonas sp.]MBJ7484690.1 response regulator [Brevundimonas sp.]